MGGTFVQSQALRRGLYASALVAIVTAAGCKADEPHPIPPPGSSTPVDWLSQLGIFQGDLAMQVPRPDFVPYDVNVSLYADGAEKHRFVFVPPGTSVHVTADRWELPIGSYLVKTFDFPIDARNPALGERLIETRFLVKTDDGFTVSTYVWNDAQTDALASAGNVDVPVSWIDEQGETHQQNFHVPGTSQCPSCHVDRALGWRSRQLDRAGAYPDGAQGQIAYLTTHAVVDGTPPAHLELSDPFGSDPLDLRARSYLDTNCGDCHGVGGSAEGTKLLWDLERTDSHDLPSCRFTPSVDSRGRVLVPGHPEQSEFLARMLAHDPFVRMPRGPTRIPDRRGIEVLTEWVSGMTPAGCPQ